MPYLIDVISIGGDFDAEIKEAAQVLNGVQNEFRFYLPPERLLRWGRTKFKKTYFNKDLFTMLHEYLDNAKAGRQYVIGVIDQRLRSKGTENLFGSRLLKSRKDGEGIAVVTLRDWAGFTESSRQFLCYYFIRYALSFLAPELRSHEDTRGCFFDFKRNKLDIKASLESGALCAEHREQISSAFTFEVQEAFEKMTEAMKSLRSDSSEEIEASSLKDQIDVGLITMKPEEYRAVFDQFNRRREVNGRNSKYLYTRIITERGEELRVIIGRTGTQAQGAAQALAASMLSDLNPRWLLVIGIAGGIPATEFSLGDVLVSQRMHDFSVSAANENAPTEFENLGSPMAPDVEKLVKDLPYWERELPSWADEKTIGLKRPKVTVPTNSKDKRLYGPDYWRKKVIGSLTANFSRRKGKRDPIVLPATIISSNTLVKDTQILQQWLLTARQSMGVEMELAGVMSAARSIGDKDTCVVAIRGISDLVGFKRGPEWTEFACHSAGAFARALLASGKIRAKT